MDWVKSQHCDTNSCVEVAWVKSNRCDTSSCVEAGRSDDQVFFRNSTDPEGPVLSFTGNQWRGFILDMKSGDFPDFLSDGSHP